jgi:Flp pilus assembly protein TadD
LSPEQARAALHLSLQQISSDWALSPTELDELLPRLRRRTFECGQRILPRGVRAGCLGLVARGRVAVWPAARRLPHPAAILDPGSVFGQAMLATGAPTPALLQALTRCELWFLQRSDLDAILATRRARQRRARMARLAPWLAAGVLVALLVVVATLPPVRQAAALAPLAAGQWCQDQGQAACAEQAWRLAATLDPGDANPQLALGTLYYRQGDVARAERALSIALDLDPVSPEAHNNLGLVYAAQGDYERAIPMFETALELEPGSAAVEHNLALGLQVTGAVDQALAHYRQAVALGDREASTRANMATAYLEAGQMADASLAAWQALVHDSSLAPAHAVLGAATLAGGDPAGAISNLQHAIALDAGYSQAYFYLGLAYQALGRVPEARAAFERAVATAPDEAMRVRIRSHLAEPSLP